MSNNIVNNVDLDKISQTVNNGKRDKLTLRKPIKLQGEWNFDPSKGYQFKTDLKYEKGKLQDFEEEYKKILNAKTHSTKRRETEKRTFRDLVDGRFDISRVIYIDRKDDTDSIFGKAADFSRESMISLEKEGYSDAQKALEEHPDLIVSKESSYKILRECCLS